MPKKIWLLAALGWSLVTAILCLVQFSNIPQVGIPSADKYVHSIFHFLFTIFWFLHFNATSNRSVVLNLTLVFTFSVLFGIAIEVAQAYFTTSRNAEFADVLANTFGAFIGVISIFLVQTIKASKQ